MSLTAQQLADLMPDATEVESHEPEMESSLRYFDAQEQLIPTPEEDAAQSQHRADRLADQLRSLGIEPEA
jgi:hypothetical protein